MADGVAIESTSPRRQVMRCDALVGKSILYNWPVVGWCVGQVVERNTDAFKIKFKFVQDDRRRASKSQRPHLLRDRPQQAVKTVLRLDAVFIISRYGSWENNQSLHENNQKWYHTTF